MKLKQVSVIIITSVESLVRGCDTSSKSQSVSATLPWKWELVWLILQAWGCCCHREPIKWRRKEAAIHLCCWSARLSLSALLIDPSRALSLCAANVARRFLSLSPSQNFIKIERTWSEKRGGDALAFCRARWNSANLHRRKKLMVLPAGPEWEICRKASARRLARLISRYTVTACVNRPK